MKWMRLATIAAGLLAPASAGLQPRRRTGDRRR
jgi:hypothetical protein